MPLFQAEQPARPFLMRLLAPLTLLLLGPLVVCANERQEDQKPDLGSGIDAWFISRSAVDEMYVAPAEQTRMDDANPEFRSVSLILRFRGQIIGVGDAQGLGTKTLNQALTNAVNNARQSKRVRELPIQLLESIGRGTTIELEIAGKPEPILGETIQDVSENLRPGIDGFAIRRGNSWHYVFPGRMQAFGQADRPNRALIRLMREAELPPRNPGELKRLEDIGFYRFETLTLTQDGPSGPPYESVRGARRIVIQSDDEFRTTAEEVAQGCIACIKGRLASDPNKVVGEVSEEKRLIALGLFGDYDFVQDDFEPLIGSPADQALVAWALARYARYDPTLLNPQREEIADLANLVLDRLGILDGVEDPPLDDPIAPALITLASLDIKQVETVVGIEYLTPAISTKARARLIEQVQQATTEEDASGITLAFWNLAAHRLQNHDPNTFETSQLEELDTLAWNRHTSQNIVGSLPWLLLNEQDNAQLKQSQRWALTVEIVNALIANQIGHAESLVADDAPAEDLIGGFVTSGATRTTATASSLRPALALAIALRSPTAPLNPALEGAWRQANQRSLRFIRQLQVNQEQAPRTAVPKRALGGIKQAAWSNVATLGDTALGLLLATELIMDLPVSAKETEEIGSDPS